MATAAALVGRPLVGATYEGGDPELLERLLDVVDYLEVTPDSITLGSGDELRLRSQELDELRDAAQSVAIVVHGVGLSIGTAEGWNPRYLRLLDELVQELPVLWHSEHLSYTTVAGEPLGTMLALPRTEAALELVSDRVRALQQRYPFPFLLENIARVLPDPDGEYDEAGFLNELCHRTGCGLVLDVYNLECDAHNHSFAIEPFLASLDFGAVHELHVAGGVEDAGVKLDVHSRQAQESTLALAAGARAAAPDLWGATYELLPEAVPVLGYDVIVDEVQRVGRALS